MARIIHNTCSKLFNIIVSKLSDFTVYCIPGQFCGLSPLAIRMTDIFVRETYEAKAKCEEISHMTNKFQCAKSY